MEQVCPCHAALLPRSRPSTFGQPLPLRPCPQAVLLQALNADLATSGRANLPPALKARPVLVQCIAWQPSIWMPTTVPGLPADYAQDSDGRQICAASG